MIVAPAELEASLEVLRRSAADPRAGLFGPGSAFWDVQRHAWIFLGAGRAALLQLAHPFVAHAIADHSDAAARPWDRFQRTFRHVFEMVFGDLDAALGAARAVRAVHARIRGALPEPQGAWARGAPYDASDAGALLWVHATLWDTSLLVHRSVLGPLLPSDADRYYADTLRFAALFGIPAPLLPPDRASFERYNTEMWSSERLHVGARARATAQALLAARPLGLGPLRDLHALLTAHWLPEPIRAGFGLPWSAARERRAQVAIGLVRRTQAHWPRRLRELPAYRSARRRLAGARRPDPLDALAQRLLTGRAAPSSASPRTR